MNAFAENPFFFFVDNALPVFPVNARNDVSKIIELSDVGCDPRMPVTAFPQNVNRCCRDQARGIKSSCKNERWKWYCEETRYPGSKSCKERCLFKGQNPNENGKLRSPTNNENRYRCQWQRQTTYQDYIDGEIKRKSVNREYNSNENESPIKRSRTRHWDRKDEFYGIRPNIAGFDREAHLQYFPGKKRVLENRYPFGLWKGSEYGNGYSEFDAVNYSETDAESAERQCLLTSTGINNLGKERLSPEQDYAEYSEEGEETPRGSSRSLREYWQKFSVLREASQSKQNCSRYNVKCARNPKQYDKSSEPDGKMENLSHGKMRSRTCSPPSDRRKRMRSFSKSIYENIDLIESERDILTYQDSDDTPSNNDNESSSFSKKEQYKESLDSTNVHKKIRNFVDRAVDTDSLSNASKISNSSMLTQCCSNARILTATSGTNKAGNNVATSFWDFIPLNNDGDQERSKIESQDNKRQNNISGCKSYPPRKQARGTEYCGENSKSKRFKNLDKDTKTCKSLSKDEAKSVGNPANAFNANSSGDSRLEHSSADSAENRKKAESKMHPDTTVPSCGLSVMQRTKKINSVAGTTIPVVPKTSAATKMQKNSEVAMNSSSRTQSQSAPVERNQKKLKNILGSIEKANRLWKRPHSATKSESSGEKKKKSTSVDSPTFASDKTIGTRIIEKTAAHLKRSFDNSKAEEISAAASQHSARTKEKKARSDDPTCSKLPIRIGTRFRSKYPLTTAVRNDDKNTDVVSQQQTNDSVELSEENSDSQRESVRSRTKPKIKPTVRQEEIPSVELKSEYLKPTEKMTDLPPDLPSDFNKNKEEASALPGNSKFNEPEREIRNSKSESRNDKNMRESCVERNTINLKVLAADCDQKKNTKNSSNASPNHFNARTRERILKTNEHRFYPNYREPKMNYSDHYGDEDQRNANEFLSRKYIAVGPRF